MKEALFIILKGEMMSRNNKRRRTDEQIANLRAVFSTTMPLLAFANNEAIEAFADRLQEHIDRSETLVKRGWKTKVKLWEHVQKGLTWDQLPDEQLQPVFASQEVIYKKVVDIMRRKPDLMAIKITAIDDPSVSHIITRDKRYAK